MVHNVTIPFSFDTSPIEAQIAKIGAEELGKAIGDIVRNGIYSAMPKKNRYYSYNSNHPKSDDEIDWVSVIRDWHKDWLDAHSQEVIDEAAMLLAMKVSRKKAWRETLEEFKAERDAE